MNQVILIGRLTKDIELRYTQNTQTAVARFTLAVDRFNKDKEADFISVKAFGNTAEVAHKYLAKGRQVAIQGRIQTGSYDKDGQKVYTTDVIADRVEFIGSSGDAQKQKSFDDAPEGFAALEEDIPF